MRVATVSELEAPLVAPLFDCWIGHSGGGQWWWTVGQEMLSTCRVICRLWTDFKDLRVLLQVHHDLDLKRRCKLVSEAITVRPSAWAFTVQSPIDGRGTPPAKS